MDADIKRKWVEALRSGEYRQVRKKLFRKPSKAAPSYCCIGVGFVACISNSIDFGDDTYHAAERLGLYGPEVDTLIDLNDNQKKSFAEIADYIEANIPAEASAPPAAER